ncbi:MAG TPA: MarR family transcriptional regulator [Polyangia bacterium]
MKAAAAPSPEAPPPRLGNALEFMRLIWAMENALQKRSRRMESELGVTAPQRLVVRMVGRFPGVQAGHLAQLLHVHPSTLTGIIQRLEKQGLIRKRVDPRDGRRTLLSLTDAGHALAAVTTGTVEFSIEQALESIPQAQLAAASDVLKAITASLDQPSSPRSIGVSHD